MKVLLKLFLIVNLNFTLLGFLCLGPGSELSAQSNTMDQLIETLTSKGSKTNFSEGLVVCSQNLNNFAFSGKLGKTAFGKPRRRKNLKKQMGFLVERFREARCDIIAVQEVAGATLVDSKKKLSLLAQRLRLETGREFRVLVGESRDGRIRNGFIISMDSIRVIDTRSYHERTIPKLNPLGPSSYYSRGPFMVYLEVKKNLSPAKRFVLVNIHLKSKSSSFKDPSKTKYELLRTRMAQGINDLVWKELRKDFPGSVLLVLGDLNSESTDAASEIIAGENSLASIYKGICKIDKDQELACVSDKLKPSKNRLVRLLHEDGQLGESAGSYRYKGKYSLIDEIMINKEASQMARATDGSFDVGYQGKLGKGSDHKLVWARLNW